MFYRCKICKSTYTPWNYATMCQHISNPGARGDTLEEIGASGSFSQAEGGLGGSKMPLEALKVSRGIQG